MQVPCMLSQSILPPPSNTVSAKRRRAWFQQMRWVSVYAALCISVALSNAFIQSRVRVLMLQR